MDGDDIWFLCWPTWVYYVGAVLSLIFSDTLRQTIYNPIMWRSLDAELFPSTYLGCDEEC